MVTSSITSCYKTYLTCLTKNEGKFPVKCVTLEIEVGQGKRLETNELEDWPCPCVS